MTTVVQKTKNRITIHTDPRRMTAVLLVFSGLTLDDAGKELGITRERVRQYLADCGLRIHRRKRRDTQSQETHWKSFYRAKSEHQKRKERIRLRLGSVVEYIQQVINTEHRVPLRVEVVRGMGFQSAIAQLCWLGGRTWESYKQKNRRMKLAYTLAGVEPPDRWQR